MKFFDTLKFKEKVAHSGRASVCRFVLRCAGLGKSIRFLSVSRRRIAASVLAACFVLTMIPAMSFPAAASTITDIGSGLERDIRGAEGLWNAAGTKTDNLIPTPTLPVVSGGKTLSTGEGSDKAGWQTHWDTQMKPAGWGSKGISGPDNALQVYATKAEDGSQTFAIRPVDGGKSGSNACLGGAGDTSERAAGISYTVNLDAYAKELADNGDLVTNVSAEFYKQEWMSSDLSISMEFLDENGKRLSSEGTKPYVKAGLGIHITTDADGVWVEWDELGGGSYVSRAVNKVAVPVGTATIRYWFCNYSNVGNARKAIKNLQANFVSTATHTHPSCGDYLCTEHENVEFSLWESNSSLPTEAGYYSLTQDVTLSSSWQLSSNVHLCLNGHTVTRTGSGTLISVASGGSLSLYDCTENSGKVTGGADGIHVRNGGALVLYGGDITANGTGVRLGTASGTGTGTFTMYGGKITDNGSTTAGERGSGVLIHGGSFTMYDGEISGNRTGGARGAAVAVGNTQYDNKSHCTFTMHGGLITDNMVGEARGSAVSVGGATSGGNALYTFHMLGGEISGNGTHTSGQGDAVIVDKNGRFTMSGGKITGNKNGVFAEAGITTLSGTAFIDDNDNNNLRLFYDEANASSPHRYLTVGEGGFDEGASIGVAITEGHDYQISSGKKYSSVTDYASADDLNYIHPDAKNTVVVYQDGVLKLVSSAHAHGNLGFVEWTSTTRLPDTAGNYCLVGDVSLSSTWNVPKGDTVLCLNGHNIIQTGNRDTIIVSSDESEQYPRTLTVYDCRDAGAITHTAGKSGSGVYVSNSTFAMYGGEISGNTDSYGGGIGTSENTHIILGGTAKVINNTATYYGGGVYIPKNSDAPTLSPSLELRDNAVVSGNRSGASAFGAGICFNGVSLVVSGSPVVSGNYKGEGTDTENNIFMEADKAITVGELTGGASIGVNTKNAPTSGRPVVFTDGAAAEQAEYFFADNSEAYEIGVDNSGKLALALKPVIQKYDLLVGGVQVTEENAGDILDNGTATYDAATNTLTISGDISTSGYGEAVVYYTGTEKLNIYVTENAAFTAVQSTVIDALDGKIKLTIADGKKLSLTAGTYAIRAKGIEIVGGSLFATTTRDAGYYVIIGTDDGILIKDSNVEVTSSVTDVYCLAAFENGDIIIDNSTVKAIANGDVWMGGVYGIYVYAQSHGKLIVKNGSKVYASGASAGVYVRSSVEAEGFAVTASTAAEADETACTETPTLSNNHYCIGEEKAKTVVFTSPSHAHDSDTFTEWTAVSGELTSGNYYLTDDFAATGVLTVASGTEVNLCLNGHTLDLGSRYIRVQGTLNIYDCQGGEGAITSATDNEEEVINNRGTLTLYSGKIVNTGASHFCYGIYSVGGLTEIKGGRVDASAGINNRSTSTLNVSGDAVITGSGDYGYAINNQGIVNVSGGEIVGGKYFGIYNANKATVTGGLVRSKVMSGICNSGSSSLTAELVVSGGTVQSGYNGSSGISIESYSKTTISGNALIETTLGGSEGIEAIGGEVYILGGTVKGDYAIRNEGAKVYISGGTLIGSSYSVYNGSVAEITGGEFTGRCGVYNYSTGTVKITGGNITGTSYGIYNRGTGTVTVSGGTVKATNSDSYGYGIYNYGTGTIKVLDGEINGINYGIYNGDGTIEVVGGTLTGTNKNGIYSEGGYIYLSGSPTISGSDDIYRYSGEIYAHANGDINDVYEGGPLTVKIRSRFTDGVVVYEVNDNNAEKFSLAESCTQTLVRVGDNLIVDGTAPTLDIKEGTNVLNKVLNTITFGLFFKETKQITIVPADNFSGVDKTYYFVSDRVLDEGELESVSWELYDGAFSLNPNTKSIIYAYTVDKAGNKSDIYGSDGIVIFTDSAADTESVTHILTTNTDKDINVTLNGNTIKSVSLGATPLTLGTDYTVSGGKITLKADYLNTLSADTHTFMVEYNPMGEAYVEANGNDEPATTEFTVKVEKADGKVDILSDISKTYDGVKADAPLYNTLGTGEVIIEYKVKGADDSTYTTTAPKDAGEYTVRVTAASDSTYKEAAATADFTIAKAIVEKPAADSTAFIYNGAEQTYTVAASEFYQVSGNTRKNAGKQTVTVALKDKANVKWADNSTADLTFEFKIEKAELTITAEDVNTVYGNQPVYYGVKYTGFKGNDGSSVVKGLECDCSYVRYGDAGEYDIVPRNATADNYNITFKKGTLTVKPAQLSDIEWIDITPVALIYNGQQKDIRITYSGWLNNDDVRFVFQLHGDNVNVTEDGFYWVLTGLAGTKAGNYLMPDDNLTSPTYQVTPRTLRESDFTAITDGRIYTGLENEPAVSSTNPLVRATDYTVAYENNINAGENTAKITITGKNNASGTVDIYFSIAKADPPVVWPFPPVGNAGDKLSTVALEDGFTWDNADTAILYGDNYYGMTYTPSNTNNYNILKKNIRVNGKDVTVPTGEITLKDDKWNDFLNDITFDLFFKETQSIRITAADTESGVKEIAYYLATEKLSIDDVKALENSKWTVYTDAFNVEPDNKYVVYARITDNAGNVIYINSDGIVLDSIKPVISGVEDGKDVYGDATFTVDEAYLDTVTLDGEPIEVKDGKYSVPADNEEHTIVVTDKTGNQVTYKLTVYKKYTVSFVVDGKEISSSEVGYGKDANLPEIPAKDGYTAKWDVDGKNITADTVITAVYEKSPGSPQTVNNTNSWLWIAVLFVSGLSLFGIVMSKKRKEREAE